MEIGRLEKILFTGFLLILLLALSVISLFFLQLFAVAAILTCIIAGQGWYNEKA
jgi:hypothetical protein